MIKQDIVKIIASIVFSAIALMQIVESFDSLIKLIFLLGVCVVLIVLYVVFFRKIQNIAGYISTILIPIIICIVSGVAINKIYKYNNPRNKQILNTSLFDTSEPILIDKERLNNDSNYALNVGLAYFNGVENINLMPNYHLAYKYINMSQAMGNIEACLPMAKIYYYGYGIEQNHQIAYEYCKKIIFSEYKPYEVITLIDKIIENDKVITDKETIEKVQIIKQNYSYLTNVVSHFNENHIIEKTEVDKLVLLANENYRSAADILTNYYWNFDKSEEGYKKTSFYADAAFKLGARSELISLIRAANKGRKNNVEDPIDTVMQYSNFEKHYWLTNKKYSIFDKYRVSKSIIENPREGIRSNDSMIFDSLKIAIQKDILSKKPILSKIACD